MTKTFYFAAGVLGAVAIFGAVLFLSPLRTVLADEADNTMWGRMAAAMSGEHLAIHRQHMAQFGGSMDTMHQAMSGLMDDMPAIHGKVMTAIAETLKITAEELQQALDGGKTLASLAEEHGVPVATLKATMTATIQRELTELVKAGKVDEQTASTMRAMVAQMADSCLTTDMSAMHGAGGMHGSGGMGGMMPAMGGGR